MTATRIPSKGTRPYRFLMQLMVKPGTFWQVCERAGIELEGSIEESVRRSLANMQMIGLVRLDANGITWHMTPFARRALGGEMAPEPTLAGEVAGPKYIGKPRVSGVQHVVMP